MLLEESKEDDGERSLEPGACQLGIDAQPPWISARGAGVVSSR
jgi:hypothetical protein